MGPPRSGVGGVVPRGVWGSLVSCLAGPCPGVYLEVLDVFGAAELRQACRPHEGKEVEKEQPVAPQDGVGPFTVAPEPVVGGQGAGPGSSRPPAPQPAGQPALTLEGAAPTKPQRPLTDRPQHQGASRGSEAPSPFKFLTIIRLPLLDHVHKVIGEDERDSLTVDSKLGLEIPQKVAEINVEQLRGGKSKDPKGVKKEGASPRGAWGGRGSWKGLDRGLCQQPCAEQNGQRASAGRQAPCSRQPHTTPTCPFSRIMMLSLCRSPMPSTYVATQ